MPDSPSIDPRRAALLLMDYQAGIVGRLADPERQLEVGARALELARSRGLTVGYVRVAFTQADLDALPASSGMGARLGAGREGFLDDAPATQIPDALAPQDGDIVVRKVRVGAFGTTDLHEQLQARGIDTLVLGGISTSGVLLSTVRDGSDRDYRLFVLSDASADPDAEVHAFLTEKILTRQATVVTLDELPALIA